MEFSFAVGVQQMQCIKVGLLNLTSADGDAGSAVAENWGKLTEQIARMGIRFLAGEFGNKIDVFLTEARKAVQVRTCGAVRYDARGAYLGASAVFVVGPVHSVTELHVPGCPTRGGGELPQEVKAAVDRAVAAVTQPPISAGALEDLSRGWPPLKCTKEKNPKIVLSHATKILVYFGSKNSRRTEQAKTNRDAGREKRAGKWDQTHGYDPWWRKSR